MNIEERIRKLADQYSSELKKKMAERVEEMESDDQSHYLLYRVLGITDEEGKLIDIYQNKGRFLYTYLGAFLEEAAFLCLQAKFPKAQKAKIKNTIGKRPKQFEIDCLINTDAIEIKWRDATTDGDHITKEHTRIQAIKKMAIHPFELCFMSQIETKQDGFKPRLKQFMMVLVGNITQARLLGIISKNVLVLT